MPVTAMPPTALDNLQKAAKEYEHASNMLKYNVGYLRDAEREYENAKREVEVRTENLVSLREAEKKAWADLQAAHALAAGAES